MRCPDSRPQKLYGFAKTFAGAPRYGGRKHRERSFECPEFERSIGVASAKLWRTKKHRQRERLSTSVLKGRFRVPKGVRLLESSGSGPRPSIKQVYFTQPGARSGSWGTNSKTNIFSVAPERRGPFTSSAPGLGYVRLKAKCIPSPGGTRCVGLSTLGSRGTLTSKTSAFRVPEGRGASVFYAPGSGTSASKTSVFRVPEGRGASVFPLSGLRAR